MGGKFSKKISQEPSKPLNAKTLKLRIHKPASNYSNISSTSNVTSLRRGVVISKKDFLENIEGSSGELIDSISKSPEDTLQIISALNNHFIFTSLTDDDKEVVAETMQLYAFVRNAFVFHQGMTSRSYYILKSGSVEVLVDEKRVNKLKAGEGFGELALLHNKPRSASIRCLEFTTVWVLERELFKKLIEDISTQTFEQNRQFLDKVSLLSSLTSFEKDALASSLVCNKYRLGQHIIREGETGNQLFIIKEGVVSVNREGLELKKLYSGQYFGEEALISQVPRTATCTAIEDPVKCVCLSSEVLQKILNYQLQEIIEKNSILEAISNSPTLSVLKKAQKKLIIADLAIHSYNTGDIIIPKGTVCAANIFIVISGRIQNARNGVVITDKGNCIGDAFMNGGRLEIKYQDDYIAGCNMKVASITKYQLEASLRGTYEQILKENSAIDILKKIFLFSSIETSQLSYLLSIMKIAKYADSATIVLAGKPFEFIFIVKRGRVDVFKNGNIVKTITKLGYFGERAIVSDGNSTATYVANGRISLWVIKHAKFERLVNESILKEINEKIEMEDEDVDLKSLTVIQQIGKGLYSRVYLVRTPAWHLYALKTYSRRKVKRLSINQQVIVRNT